MESAGCAKGKDEKTSAMITKAKQINSVKRIALAHKALQSATVVFRCV